MAKRSFFMKNFTSYAAIVLIALLLAAAVFVQQVDQYALEQKQQQLMQEANNVAQQTQVVLENYSTQLDRIYQISLVRIAADNDVTILIVNKDGGLRMKVTGEGVTVYNYGVDLPTDVVRQTLRDGSYSSMSMLGDVLSELSYIGGTQCLDSYGDVAALVYVSAASDDMSGMMKELIRIYIIIAIITLICILAMTYFISSRMTLPLKNMANASKLFAQGDFSVRVPEDNKCDEIDELAQAFNNMAGDLSQLEELTRGFIGNVSHEFKTPMTTIGGFVDGMLDGTIPPAQHQKYLHIISEEVHRLSRMVVRMLDAAKIQSGEMILASAPFDFSEMASQIILSFEQKLNDKHVDVDVTFADKLMVFGDRDHVYRAVYNLVDNAAKFVDQGGTLRLRAQEENHMCAFSICNTGGGIAPEDISHIFDRFYKADPSRSRDRSGAGLGLYIVKNIINLHGGDISVRSDGGETEFSFTLPLASKVLGKAQNRSDHTDCS